LGTRIAYPIMSCISPSAAARDKVERSLDRS
jgi:hypothetical protein